MGEFETRFLAFGCTHLPIHCEEFRQWRLDKIREFKPHVIVNLGDWHDADYAARWDNENKWDARKEFEELRRDALDINAAAPRAKKVWVHGNHDDNDLEPGRISEKLRDVIRTAKEAILGDALEGWQHVRYGHDEFYRLGQVTFQHGCQTNVNAERDQALLYAVPFGLHASAHTHRPIQPTPIVLPGKVPVFGMEYTNVGCGADWTKMRYINRSNHALWGRAVLIGSCNAKQRRAWFGSKPWDAELLIHSRASDR